MLLSDGLIQLCLSVAKCAKRIPGCPSIAYKWSTEKGRFVEWKSVTNWIWIVIYMILGIGTLHNLVYKPQDAVQLSMGIFTCACRFANAYWVWVVTSSYAEITLFVNMLLVMEKHLNTVNTLGGQGGSRDLYIKLAKVLCKLLELTMNFLPILLAIGTSVSPCTQMNTVNAFLPCDSWWDETTIRWYTSLFNSSHVGILVSTLLLVGVVQVTMAYAGLELMGLATEISSLATLSIVLLAVDTWLVIVIFYGFAGMVHYTAKRVSREIKGMTGLMENPTFQKYLLSCPILSIKFGTTNFIEMSTPLRYQDFCIARFVDLLLLGKSNKN
ncbi:unnamed protein product [Orchesella dallaii]|uniref:Gustatory receptor n=1 Tax=Orchesella dallaii TaxID=48710 RepID=A0ABP1QJ64_9HEXA